jgi:3-phosphoshikimate 1-carboxyvinyltransferase
MALPPPARAPWPPWWPRPWAFHYLDSGAIYRVTAYAAQRAGLSLDDEAALARLARGLDLRFEGGEVFPGR